MKFVPRDEEETYVEVVSEEGKGCLADKVGVDYTKGRNKVYLERADDETSCVDPCRAMHELLHIIGLFHEQERHGAAERVLIHFDKVEPDERTQFMEIPATAEPTPTVPYSYGNVMHYGKSDYATDEGDLVIETLWPEYQDAIGKSKSANRNDFVCTIYSCKRCMGKPFVGYTDEMRNADDDDALVNAAAKVEERSSSSDDSNY